MVKSKGQEYLMNSRIWLKSASALLGVIACVQAYEIFFPISRGPEEDTLMYLLKKFHFTFLGSSNQSHWNLYHGSSILVFIGLALLSAICLQAESLSKTDLPRARTLILTLFIGAFAFSFTFCKYFAVPFSIASILATICLGISFMTSFKKLV